MIDKRIITRALQNWTDYKEIAVKRNDATPTANAKKLVSTLKKVAKQTDEFQVVSVNSSDYYGEETAILLASPGEEAIDGVAKVVEYFSKSIGYKINRKEMSYDAYDAKAIYTLENTESFCSMYSFYDEFKGIILMLVKLRENV